MTNMSVNSDGRISAHIYPANHLC